MASDRNAPNLSVDHMPIRNNAAASDNERMARQPAQARVREGWKAVLIRQARFDALKQALKTQDQGKRALDLAELADGIVSYVLADPERTKAAIVEGRNSKRLELLRAADEWAD